EVLEEAQWSHAHGRSVFCISQRDTDLARLFSYAFRSHTIGTFHATSTALEEKMPALSAPQRADLEVCCTILKQLEDKAVDPVPEAHRALISTFYYYDSWVNAAIEQLSQACARNACSRLEEIRRQFVENIETVTNCNGIYTACDQRMPAQGAFIVPNLGIAIV